MTWSVQPRRVSSLVAVLAVACSVLLAAACGGGDSTESADATAIETAGAATGAAAEGTETAAQPASGEPLRVGLAQPLTGPVASAGIAVRDGAELAVEEINAQGGVNGRPIELVVEDDANDPAQCTSVAQKLATQDRVPVAIGMWGSSCTLPTIPIWSRAQIPLVVETSGAPAITDPEEAWTEWIFRLAPTGSQEAAAMAKVLAATLGTKSFFQLAVNNDFGRSFADAYSAALEAQGAEDRGRAYFEQADQDFSSQVTQAKESGADTIIVITDVGQIAVILQQLKAQGVDARVVTSGGSNSPDEVLRLAGPDIANGHYAAIYFPYFDPSLSEDPERAQAFVDEWLSGGHEIGQVTEAARGYDAVNVVADALARASDPEDGASIAEALRAAQTKGVIFGDIAFQEWNGLQQQNVPPVFLVQVKDGKVEVVEESKPPY